jgi:hypothetical protein
MATTSSPKTTVGDIVMFHRAHGVHRGVVLASGKDGARVLDAFTGDKLEVRHEGIYRHITIDATDLRAAVAGLHGMGLRVHLTDAQRIALEE